MAAQNHNQEIIMAQFSNEFMRDELRIANGCLIEEANSAETLPEGLAYLITTLHDRVVAEYDDDNTLTAERMVEIADFANQLTTVTMGSIELTNVDKSRVARALVRLNEVVIDFGKDLAKTA